VETVDLVVDGRVVVMRRVGWRDLRDLPLAVRAIGDMPHETDADEAAFWAAWEALADRVDAYAAGPVLPSSVPVAEMIGLVDIWVSGVRDAALPPAPGSPGPSQPSTPPAASRRKPRRRS
jgi:hypothetical protein